MKAAVFFDRDGTLIEDRGYICHFRQVRLFPFAVDALHMLNDAGWLTVMVTNQSAIARGLCTCEQVEELHRRLRRFIERRGARIDAIYYCPFFSGGGVERYSREDACRKPAPGMLLRAAAELDIDMAKSFMVGDEEKDIEAGKRAGCRTILVQSGKPIPAPPRPASATPDYVVSDLLEASRLICSLAHACATPIGNE